MRQALPRQAKFLLSEDMREEAQGKMTIVGLFTDDKIYVDTTVGPVPPGVVAVLSSLTITCTMSGGSGTFPAVSTIVGPSRQLLARVSGNAQFRPGATTTLALKSIGVALPSLGTYRVNVKVGRKEFDYSFDILQGPPPGLAAANPIGTRRPSAPSVTSRVKRAARRATPRRP
jgi:hypothetical protein